MLYIAIVDNEQNPSDLLRDHHSRYQETNHTVILMTWAAEQTIREIYRKSFEIVIKGAATNLVYVDDQGQQQTVENFRAATGVMTAFNRVGNTWSGGNNALLQTVLRDEWGFDGTALRGTITCTPCLYFTAYG